MAALCGFLAFSAPALAADEGPSVDAFGHLLVFPALCRARQAEDGRSASVSCSKGSSAANVRIEAAPFRSCNPDDTNFAMPVQILRVMDTTMTDGRRRVERVMLWHSDLELTHVFVVNDTTCAKLAISDTDFMRDLLAPVFWSR